MVPHFSLLATAIFWTIVMWATAAELDGTSAPSPGAIAQSYVRCVERSDIACAVNLFHFPADSSPSELKSDRHFIKSALELFAAELGKPSDFQFVSQPADAFIVSVGGGTLPYWQQHPDFRRFTVLTKFQREGPGTIMIDLCIISGRPEIRQVHYGLPRSRPDGQARITEIIGKLQNLMASHT